MRSQIVSSIALLGIFAAGTSVVAEAQAYKVTNIISDGSVPAALTDPNFINPWGVSASGNWWISAQGSGYNYVVNPAGAILFKVIVPAASGLATATGLPAGSVTTAGAVGMILPNGTKASFLFSTLDGTISGWNRNLGFNNAISQIAVNNGSAGGSYGGSAGASYPGLAILNIATGGVTSSSYILAPNFGAGNAIEVYDSTFKAAKLAGSFTDPTLPTGYAPFAVHIIGTQVFVTYALRSATAPYNDVAGLGNGAVSVFDNNGNFVSRLVTGGNLNSPWGVAIAPASFGIFSGDLLIGNVGNGLINVYDPKTFGYLGQLMDGNGSSLAYANLWELLPGGTKVTGTAAVSAGDPTTVYFTAGLANEAHGLFGNIGSVTTAGATPTFGFTVGSGGGTVSAGSSAQATVSVAPANGFSGTVSLSCIGLPVGATCSFSPASLPVTATAPAISTVTIATTKTTTGYLQPFFHGASGSGVMSAMLFPLASLLLFHRRRSLRSASAALRLLGVLLVSLMVSTAIAGCGGSPIVTPATPTGSSQIVISASSGGVTQQTSFTLVVK